ncbi:site-specific DNA-methyltransferase [Microvirga splendida]|uniref:site-specific DNA-methyltransferase (adenine-specific) n=1 Tax=Microvirga splendida TaxID=2795727 RepID=A0ABS0XXL4_9HYPH|nr:site-specific DNA-methyltransferase [Microvirga splendida]MBJ6124787.1 site-specific DNA-methyltransferase [Microvirga splendida]
MPILHWLTRDDDTRAVRSVPYRLLQEDPSHSCGDADAANMLIQGDNLEALKALLPFYAGQVKCIYIDPPYNTRSAFQHYDDNLEHTQWLAMMWPRLELLRDLLAEDGSIWVSIDDNEGHYLKVIMDEVFGRSNFIANVVWQKKYTVANDAKYLAENHDHIIAFALNKGIWNPNRLARSEEMDSRYRNPDNHPKGPWKATPLYAKRTPSEKEKAFKITFKNGVEWCPPKGTTPRFPYETLRRMDDNDEIWFGADGNASPSRKTFLSELKISGAPAPTLWLHADAGHNHEAREEAKAFRADTNFDTPKPERLLQRILHIATNPGDLVLDSFLGSGTTAAVAHKMGRRYIGIEMGEHAVTHCAPRLSKVIAGEQGGISQSVGWQGGGGFRFYRLGPPVFDENGHIRGDIRFPTLAAHVWFSETNTPWSGRGKSPCLGIHGGRAYALLYNGILGDRRPDGGNVLTRSTLQLIREAIAKKHPAFDGPVTVYGEQSRLGAASLEREGITFKQTPYDVKARR